MIRSRFLKANKFFGLHFTSIKPKTVEMITNSYDNIECVQTKDRKLRNALGWHERLAMNTTTNFLELYQYVILQHLYNKARAVWSPTLLLSIKVYSKTSFILELRYFTFDTHLYYVFHTETCHCITFYDKRFHKLFGAKFK